MVQLLAQLALVDQVGQRDMRRTVDQAEGNLRVRLIAKHAISWWKERGEDPREKLVIFSDGLDAEKIVELHQQFAGRVKVSFGWGTMLTNDFKGLTKDDRLAPFSLVCKAVSANGHPTVKLSDNPNKAMGPAEEIERYKRVFGVGPQDKQAVVV